MSDEPAVDRYDGTPVPELLDAGVPDAQRDFFCYLMGPYTIQDARYLYDDADELETPYASGPLVDPHRFDSFEDALSDIADELRERYDIRAFIATDVDVPTRRDVVEDDLDAPWMTPGEQSIAFARYSDLVCFVFSHAGLTTGTGGELGTVGDHFDLRTTTDGRPLKPRDRFRVYYSPTFASATIERFPADFGLDDFEYESRADFFDDVEPLVQHTINREGDDDFPLYRREPESYIRVDGSDRDPDDIPAEVVAELRGDD